MFPCRSNFFLTFYCVELQQDCVLLNTRKVRLEPRDAEVVFGTSAYNKTVQNGDIVGLIYSGSRCIYSCQKVRKTFYLIDYF